jgi:uncharacterized membrane protein
MLKIIRNKLQTSIWFIPLVMSLVSILLAVSLVTVDLRLQTMQWSWLQTLRIGVDGVRQVLSVTTGAMMTITGVVFSITVVSLTLASNQLGPKVLRNYLRDPANKWVLGWFISSFLYGLVVLTSIDSQREYFVPVTAFLVSLVLTVIAVVGLIYFIHNIAVTIQADHMIARIGDELVETVRHTLQPLQSEADEALLRERWTIAIHGAPAHPFGATHNGYVEYIDYSGLLQTAAQHNMFCDLRIRAGDFVIEDCCIAVCYANTSLDTESVGQALRECISLSRQRTPLQDIEYAVTQLMQIALRALSPGINDASTAIACVDWLSASLGCMAGKRFPADYRKDENDVVRMKTRSFDFRGVANAIFDPLRQNARTNEMVLIRLLEVIAGIMEVSGQREHLKIMRHHASLVYQTAESSFPDKADVETARSRYNHCVSVYDREVEKLALQQPRPEPAPVI